MNIQSTTDGTIQPHGNWQGLSVGWVVTIWLMHILTQHTHQMDCVQEWVGKHLVVLRKLTGQQVTALDFTDDRLALCLRYLAPSDRWSQLENRLTKGVIQVYDLKKKLPERWLMRLDATVGSVGHDAANHTLFQVGKAKNGLYETLFKMMVASWAYQWPLMWCRVTVLMTRCTCPRISASKKLSRSRVCWSWGIAR
jgi:transposase